MFKEMSEDDRSGAIISACGKYRYHLWRRWDELSPMMVWVMLNPSTADATTDDPTIRRCIGFAKLHGCGGISVKNVFALRVTDPRELLSSSDPFGENEDYLLGARSVTLLTKLVVGWGAKMGGKRLAPYYAKARVLLLPQKPNCFGTTKSGDPRHPLYLPNAAPLIPWFGGCS
jgi:hypothetical protein